MGFWDKKKPKKGAETSSQTTPETQQQLPQVQLPVPTQEPPKINPPTTVSRPMPTDNTELARHLIGVRDKRLQDQRKEERKMPEKEPIDDETADDESENDQGDEDQENYDPEDDEIDEAFLLENDDLRRIVHEGLDKGQSLPQIHKEWAEYSFRGVKDGDIKPLTIQAVTSHKRSWNSKSVDNSNADVPEAPAPVPKRVPKVVIPQLTDPIDIMFQNAMDGFTKKSQKESNLHEYIAEFKDARDEGDVHIAQLMLIAIKKELDRMDNAKTNPEPVVAKPEKNPYEDTMQDLFKTVVTNAINPKSKKDPLDDALSIVDRIDKIRGGNNNGMPTPDDPDSWMWYTMGQVIPQSVDKITDAIGSYAGHGSLRDNKPMNQNPNQQQQQQQQIGFRCDACKATVPLDSPACQKCGNRFPPEMWRQAKAQMGIPDQHYMNQQPAQPQQQPQRIQQAPQRPQYPAYQEQPRPPAQPAQQIEPEEEEIPEEPMYEDLETEDEPYDPEVHGVFCSYCGGHLDNEGFCPRCTTEEDIDVPEQIDQGFIQPQPSPPVGDQVKEKGPGEIIHKSEGMGLTAQSLPELPPEAINMFNQLHRVAMWVKIDANARQNGDQKNCIDPVDKVSSLYRLADRKGKDLDLIKTLMYIRKRGIQNLIYYVEMYSHDPRIKEAPEVVKVLTSENGINWSNKALDTLYQLASNDGILLTKEDIARIDNELRLFTDG
ncbi:hypothetical protein [Sulfuricurvum sp.]|uniref:hypothetical protein n=1 Tax=Sulfuricurvum sp. TaxID=2025608 RepID=UPI003569544F